METTVSNGMCRCCASEGLFKDMYGTYSWMGEDEVYADMLQFCFDITLSTAEDQNNGGICEVCITQLRNAANFKKQVQHTEVQFQKLQEQKAFFPKPVKLEISLEDEPDSENNISDDYQSGTEFAVAIKEESPEPKPKKRSSKATSSRVKKSKTDSGETSTKRIEGTTGITKNESENDRTNERRADCTIKLKRIKSHSRELVRHHFNVREVLLWSNATPIKSEETRGYTCCYCDDVFRKPKDLKEHTIINHTAASEASFTKRDDLGAYYVKLDISNLQCKICNKEINTLDELTIHLVEVHKKHLYNDVKNHMMPFKFDGDTLRCFICSREFRKFKLLIEHMQIHCRNYICDICDSGFINRRSLKNHANVHKTGQFQCGVCKKTFHTQQKRKSHERVVHTHGYLLNKCGYCDEKFSTVQKKEQHMFKEHGIDIKPIKCSACDQTFTRQSGLSRHIKRWHLMERDHACTICGDKFFRKNNLMEHMVKHSGEKKYQCDVCHKFYTKKGSLQVHIRSHQNDRRFKCMQCDQTFLQKVTLRLHISAKH